MIKTITFLMLMFHGISVVAWDFEPPIRITAPFTPGVFHHLESSGRHNIAVSQDYVAVIWEDNRNNTPGIYLSFKQSGSSSFEPSMKISGSYEAYEPSIIYFAKDVFITAWEENEHIILRPVSPNGPGEIFQLPRASATQASLTSNGKQIFLIFSALENHHYRVFLQSFSVQQQGVSPLHDICPVDSQPALADQLYPAAAISGQKLFTAWEDRRPGHTVILGSHTTLDMLCQAPAPYRISEKPKRRSNNNPMQYGSGHGVSRVSLATHGPKGVTAIWADKRDFREGYDIYAAEFQAETQTFAPNKKVQDEFGSVAQQWHASISGHPSDLLIAAWDDNRDGTADIMLSEYLDKEWSDNIAVPGASIANLEESHPSLILDQSGDLHLVWVRKESTHGPTELYYLNASP